MKTNIAPKSYIIPWDAWHEDEHFTSLFLPSYGKEITFPESWDVRMVDTNHVPAAHGQAIANSLDSPIGTRPLAKMAREAGSVAIAVEDMTRPASLQSGMDLLLGALETSGIDRRHIRNSGRNTHFIINGRVSLTNCNNIILTVVR